MRIPRRIPRLALVGLEPDVELLYDGTMLAITARWWNGLLRTNREFQRYNFLPFDDDRVRRLQATVQPENRWTFKAVGDHIAGFGKLSEAAAVLGYAFARTFGVGATSDMHDPSGIGWRRGQVITEHAWNALQDAYGPSADWLGYEQQGPFWDVREHGTTTTRYAVRAVRWAYRDQVKRWGPREVSRSRRASGWTRRTSSSRTS